MIRSTSVAAVALAAALVVAPGCGGGDDGSDDGAARETGPPPSSSAAGTEKVGAGALGPEVEILAGDLFLKPGALTVAAGPNTFRYVNKGSLPHTLRIDDGPKLKLKVDKKGDEASETVRLEPGEYTLYCDIPGHRDGGMESKLTVE